MSSLRLPFLAVLLVGLLWPAAVRAQSIHWEPPGGALAAGQTTSLQLVCDDCEPKETPQPPKVDGLSLQYAGESNNMSFVNGSYSHSVTYSYAALLTKKQSVQIPSFEVETNKGRLSVPAVRYQPANATVGSTGQPLESAANSRLEATPQNVWAGEVFKLGYSVQATRGYYPDFGHGVFDWNPDPLIAEDWSHPEPFDLTSGSEPQTGLVYHTRAIAPKPGSYRLNPVNQLVNLSVGVTGFGFFQQRQYQQFSVTSTTPTIQVRALPPAPAGFSGAVGSFKLISKVVPEKATIGEPVTWTLELSGTGNWPDIAGLPARTVSKDFQVIQPKAKRVPAEGKLFDVKLTEDVVLVPTVAGSYPLAAMHFVYFDPKLGDYATLTAAGTTVTVTAPAGVPQSGSAATAQTPPGTVETAPANPVAAPPLPEGLPRDPLPEAGTAPVPLGSAAWSLLVLAPFVLLLGYWLCLARQSARLTDPQRIRREARERLSATIAEIRGSPAPSSLLLAWQRDAAVLWGIAHAAPPPAAVGDPAWTALWSEAERALYGADASLPADWCARAEAALAAASVPAFASRQLFRRHNLFPFLALVALMAGNAFAIRAAESNLSGAGAYSHGDFAGAEKAWRSEIAAQPTAWAARHNLSLALAQQDHWDEAAAHAAAAFVQQPGNAAVRWQFELACKKAGFVPEPLADFLDPGPLQHLAALASPSVWQFVLIAAAVLAAGALAGALAQGYSRYRRTQGWVLPAIISTLVLSLGLTLAAVGGWRAYGEAADTQAVVVWRNSSLRSIPTEADTSQKTAPLAAGSVARIDRNFLGWVRLAFANGQTGWVRREEVVWLWR